jgi:hypothetical protein
LKDSAEPTYQSQSSAAISSPVETMGTPAARPVAAGVGRQAPRIRLALVAVEDALEFGREFARHQYLMLAHPEEARQVLEFDRTGRLTVAAGGAGPQGFGLDDPTDQRRQFGRRLAPGLDGSALVPQVVLECVVDPLHRQRLASQEGRTGVLAAPHSVQV